MTNIPPIPRAGEPISATWMASLVRFVKSIRPLQGPGVLLDRSPNGTVFRVAGSGAKKGASADHSCFKLESRTRDGGEPYLTVANRFYTVGDICGYIDEEEDIDLTALIKREDEEEDVGLASVVALRVSATGGDLAPEVVAYDDMDALIEAQKDEQYAVMPLYLFDVSETEDEDGEAHTNIALKADLRFMPHTQLVEVLG